MSLTNNIRRGWRQFWAGGPHHDRQRLVELLRAEYVEEAQDAVQFTHHA
jgi:hypothetical protein